MQCLSYSNEFSAQVSKSYVTIKNYSSLLLHAQFFFFFIRNSNSVDEILKQQRNIPAWLTLRIKFNFWPNVNGHSRTCKRNILLLPFGLFFSTVKLNHMNITWIIHLRCIMLSQNLSLFSISLCVCLYVPVSNSFDTECTSKISEKNV